MILEKIISDCKKGNRLAQKVLYDKYSKQMYGICLRYCRRTDLAADAMQNGFVKVFRNILAYKGDGEIGAWIRIIIVRACLEIIKQEKNLSFTNLDDITEPSVPEKLDIDLDKFDYKRMMKHLQKLPTGYRIVFSMYVLDELRHNDIADSLGISINTSRSQLLKARKMLQNSIKEDDYLMSQYRRL